MQYQPVCRITEMDCSECEDNYHPDGPDEIDNSIGFGLLTNTVDYGELYAFRGSYRTVFLNTPVVADIRVDFTFVREDLDDFGVPGCSFGISNFHHYGRVVIVRIEVFIPHTYRLLRHQDCVLVGFPAGLSVIVFDHKGDSISID